MSFNFDNYNLDDLTQHKARLTSTANHFKDELVKIEEELKVVAEKIKTFTSETVSSVQDKAEEAVEAVKEEVKKVASKRTSKKATEKTEETVKESDK